MSHYDYDPHHINYDDNEQNQGKNLNYQYNHFNPKDKINSNPFTKLSAKNNSSGQNYSNTNYKSTPNLNPSQYTFENNNSNYQNYLMTKPEKVSENLNDHFIVTQTSPMNFPKRENSFTMNKSQMESEEFSLISQDSNRLRIQLMEKDKIIIEYSKVLKETERVLENTKKLNFSKDELITNLKDEIKNLKFKLKNSEISIQNKNEEFEKFQKFVEEKIFNLNSEKSNLEEKLGELTKIYENNQMEFQNTLIEYKKMEKKLINLNKTFMEKNEQITSYEKLQEDLKKENKNIPLIKKQIHEMEKTISELKSEIQTESMKKEKIQSEKEDIETRLKEQMEENRMEKDANVKILKLSYEIENLKKEIEEKSRENEKISEKNKSTMKENDIFVQYFTNELSEFLNVLESFGSFKNGLNEIKNFNSNKKNHSTFTSYSNHSNFSNQSHTHGQEKKLLSVNNSQLNFKYELVNKNIDLLKNKIFENFNEFTNFTKRKEKKEIELESQIKELTNERSSLLKEISLNKQKINEFSEKNIDISANYEKLIEDCKVLKEKFVKAKSDYEEEKRKNENICKEVHLFLTACFEKLKTTCNLEADLKIEKISSNNSMSLDYTERLLYLLDIILEEHKKLSKREKELYETLKMSQMEIKNSQEEKEAVKFKLDRILLSKEEDEKNSEIMKNEELKRQREILYEKISSLTNLLEESNAMISLYENENRELKEKVNKMEFNLKMLTKSHLELENSITGNATLLQCEIDDKENKHNKALREIELKNIHIESIENILKRKDEEIARLNEVLFIYKNNQFTEKQAEEGKNYGEGSEKKESVYENYKTGLNDKFINEVNQNYQNSHNNYGNNQNNMINQDNRNFNNNHNYHDSDNIHSNNQSKNKNSTVNYENKNFMSESGNRFLINEEKERELQKLISGYNLDKSEYSYQDDKNESSITNRMNTKKIPGRIFSVKKCN